ncbi:MAG: hypothetical protein ACR2H3_02525 [Acidimicrobiales bacterium]
METFKRQRFTGWIRSSDGYAVRIVGRNDLQYADERRQLHLFVEPLANYSDIVLDPASIPVMPETDRTELLDRIRRAFGFAGWTLLGPSA